MESVNQSTATLIAAVIAFLGVMGTASASLIAIWIKAQKDREIAQLKVLHDLQADYDKDLRTRRIEAYLKLWKQTIALARYPEPNTLTYEHVNELANSFRIWYFAGGGLIMPEDTRDLYFDIQDGFRIVLQKRTKHWSFDNTKINDSALLNKYLGRPTTHKIPQDIEDIAKSDLPPDDAVPESIALHLRALGSKLRTGMSDDVLTRREPVLQSGVQNTPAKPAAR